MQMKHYKRATSTDTRQELMIVTELAIGALIGLIISTTGVSGGVIVLPILTYFFGLNALAAATATFDANEGFFFLYAFSIRQYPL